MEETTVARRADVDAPLPPPRPYSLGRVASVAPKPPLRSSPGSRALYFANPRHHDPLARLLRQRPTRVLRDDEED